MRYFILLLILIGFVGIAFAMHDPNDPNPHPTMPQMQNDPNTIKQFHSQYDKIEFIGGKPFFVSEKYDANPVSNETMTFHGVNFTHPSYPEIPNPGGFVSTAVTFEDGTKKSVSVGFTPNPIPVLTERKGVFAGMMRDSDGLHFLVSVDLTQISPLKQIKSGIPIDKITCKENLQLIIKNNGNPACVKPDTIPKLVERNSIELSSFYQSRPLIERLHVAMVIIQFSDIPTTILGLDHDQILGIEINDEELNKIPNAQEYYEQKIREIIPFDVPIKVTFGKYWE